MLKLESFSHLHVFLEKHDPKETILLLDIDNTLLFSEEGIGSVEWVNWKFSQMNNVEEEKIFCEHWLQWIKLHGKTQPTEEDLFHNLKH